MTAAGGQYERYVAVGDSQSEGLLDPDGHGGYRGWADRFAEFAADGSPTLQYANLAVRGKLIGQIHAEQLAPAQALQPDLVSVMGGLNDLLRPEFDIDVVLGHLDALLAGFPDATVLTNTFPDLGVIAPTLARLAPRVHAYNDGIRHVAADRGALVVDFAARGVGTDPRIWSPDRIHATAVGHAVMAAAFADALGLPGFDGWAEPLPAFAPGRGARLAAEVRWVGGMVVPWLYRRARGRSSGDGVTAKRPDLLPVAPLFHLLDPAVWDAAVRASAVRAATLYRPASLDTEGFVHLSFAHQVAGSANRHLADAAQLVALEVDAARAGSRVLVEDSYGSGTSFPHLYGALPVEAVSAVHPVTRGDDGSWNFRRA